MHAGSLPAQLALSTDRLILRPLETADVELLWPDIADPEISRLMAWDAHTTREQTVTFVDSEWPIVDRNGRNGMLIWPDYKGEQVRGIISERRVSSAWRARVMACSAWLLLIRL